MSEAWSIEEEARRLCFMPTDELSAHGGVNEAAGDCRCKAIARGIRAGLEHAIAVQHQAHEEDFRLFGERYSSLGVERIRALLGTS